MLSNTIPHNHMDLPVSNHNKICQFTDLLKSPLHAIV
jgi:hypothetical protein